jgi:uncharacterized protein YydD (DUF2326 family)
MFLKSLYILNDEEVIREIIFRQGINLIVDETKSDSLKETGNNVGKTTVLRLVYFCLGGNGKNIYQDQEFKDQENTLVKNFLFDENIIIQLTLADNLSDEASNEVTIRRNFLPSSDRILEINGKKIQSGKFQEELSKHILDYYKKKPSFKQIVSKNIRDAKKRLDNTVKVLGAYTGNDNYEPLFLFWLGIDLDFASRKQELNAQIKADIKLKKRFEKTNTLPQLNQFITVVNRNIKELEKTKKEFNLNEDYEKELAALTKVKLALNSEMTKISRLEVRRELILESKHDLESDLANVDEQKVRDLYSRAKALMPNLQKSFEETIAFHNEMIGEKVNFIAKELPELEASLVDHEKVISELLKNEAEISSNLVKSKTIEELEKLIVELNRAYEQKGKLEEQRDQLQKITKGIDTNQEELDGINKGITTKSNLIEKRVEKFNEYFTSLSKELYDEQLVLIPVFDLTEFSLSIQSLNPNSGTGKKKGEIAAFDLAYIQFADDLDISCLHFIMHDRIENIHKNQISTLFNIVEGMNCQYIVSVLKDKLPSTVEVDKYKVISLSQDDKLFRIE